MTTEMYRFKNGGEVRVHRPSHLEGKPVKDAGKDTDTNTVKNAAAEARPLRLVAERPPWFPRPEDLGPRTLPLTVSMPATFALPMSFHMPRRAVPMTATATVPTGGLVDAHRLFVSRAMSAMVRGEPKYRARVALKHATSRSEEILKAQGETLVGSDAREAYLRTLMTDAVRGIAPDVVAAFASKHPYEGESGQSTDAPEVYMRKLLVDVVDEVVRQSGS